LQGSKGDADYAPETVNTDGWQATQHAWQALFNPITVILCFLHALINIRDRTKKAFGELATRCNGESGKRIAPPANVLLFSGCGV
jgi:hypothetical protein